MDRWTGRWQGARGQGRRGLVSLGGELRSTSTMGLERPLLDRSNRLSRDWVGALGRGTGLACQGGGGTWALFRSRKRFSSFRADGDSPSAIEPTCFVLSEGACPVAGTSPPTLAANRWAFFRFVRARLRAASPRQLLPL